MNGREEELAERLGGRVEDLVGAFASDPNPPLRIWESLVARDPGAPDPAAALDRIAIVHLVRQAVIRRWTWAVPSGEVLDAIAEHAGGRDVVEVGAGTGFWAMHLAARGVWVESYDAAPPERTFVPIEVGGPEAAGRHPDAVLLLVWPPHRSSMAAEAVVAHADAGGQRVIYVGEDRGGWTADDDLFELFDDEYTEIARIEVPSWPGYDDHLVVYERR